MTTIAEIKNNSIVFLDENLAEIKRIDMGENEDLLSFTFSDCGSIIAVGYLDTENNNIIKLYDVHDLSLCNEKNISQYYDGMDYKMKICGEKLVFIYGDSTIMFLNILDMSLEHLMMYEGTNIIEKFSNDGSSILLIDDEGNYKIISTKTHEEVVSSKIIKDDEDACFVDSSDFIFISKNAFHLRTGSQTQKLFDIPRISQDGFRQIKYTNGYIIIREENEHALGRHVCFTNINIFDFEGKTVYETNIEDSVQFLDFYDNLLILCLRNHPLRTINIISEEEKSEDDEPVFFALAVPREEWCGLK